jgi:hypothetical protein
MAAGIGAPGIQQHMGELTFSILAIAVAILVWIYALRLLRRLYRSFREQEKDRTDRARQGL